MLAESFLETQKRAEIIPIFLLNLRKAGGAPDPGNAGVGKGKKLKTVRTPYVQMV
jgi:hypothetical protein